MNIPSSRRRFGLHLSALAWAAAAWSPLLALADDGELRAHKLFTSTNAAGNNELLVYTHAADGSLSLLARAATGAQGSGAALGSQGAVTLAGDGRHMYVVNAASHAVSAFAIRGNGVAWSRWSTRAG